MKVTTMKLADLVKPEKNVRIHTANQLKEFERSVSMFGQIRPIVIDENNVILAGNGLYDTLVAMGRETADVYQYKDLTENQKKKLMIADNKIFSLGIENLDTLNQFLDELDGDLDIPGFDEEILKQMVADAEDVTEKISEYGTLDEEEIKEIKERNEKQSTVIDTTQVAPVQNVPESFVNEQDGKNNTEGIEEPTEIRKFVICPKCGEKIWL